ncbi:uncharacterized protein BJ212DRAFT_1303827 [Suillus subaureus]|uniref:Uncharacterized protein n=1 Tax=Suillus subaureus TaxID=48587 RepID=A0A9P7J724_9AGAM|nr:uncharacterized protein BJ212DRAFT_1303827 [Suillus subaureus]KAG1805968.1 hypothetical protein BJ212DRAFT_1303827 [Suillus subaureus]
MHQQRIITCWVPDDGEWQRVGRLVANRKYQHVLDRLEGLVVARIFELLKMNRAGTAAQSRMDLHFKMCQAHEEICCLDIEVHHLMTYIRDEDKYLRLPGFTGTLIPGLSACTSVGESASMPDPWIPADMFAANTPIHRPSSSVGADTQEDLDEEEVAEEVAEEASRSLQHIILITDDFSWLQVLDDGEAEE